MLISILAIKNTKCGKKDATKENREKINAIKTESIVVVWSIEWNNNKI